MRRGHAGQVRVVARVFRGEGAAGKVRGDKRADEVVATDSICLRDRRFCDICAPHIDKVRLKTIIQ